MGDGPMPSSGMFATDVANPTGEGCAGLGQAIAVIGRMSPPTLTIGPDATPALRDVDMRALLEAWIRANYGDSPTAILHELRIPRPSARVDVAVVNGELSAFEIKSDVDTLWRLPRQVRSFDCVFDRVSLVTTEKHLREVRAVIPRWWGIVTIASTSDDVRQRRQARINPRRQVVSLLHVLSRPELLSLAARVEFQKGCSGLPRQALVDRLARVPAVTLRGHVRDLLTARTRIISYSSPPSSSSFSPAPPGSESCAAE